MLPVTLPNQSWFATDVFEVGGMHSLVPIQFVKCRTVSLVDKLDGESVLFLSPCIDF